MRLATEIICEWLSVQSTVSAIASSVDVSQKSRGKMAAVTKKKTGNFNVPLFHKWDENNNF